MTTIDNFPFKSKATFQKQVSLNYDISITVEWHKLSIFFVLNVIFVYTFKPKVISQHKNQSLKQLIIVLLGGTSGLCH